MATLGYVAPISQQSSESFHALRRTVEGTCILHKSK
jgi:hypothetical protein